MSKENVNLSTLLLESRILFIGSEINPEMANAIVSALLYLDSVSHEPIKLYINSGGENDNVVRKVTMNRVLTGEGYSLDYLKELCSQEKFTKQHRVIGF